jgi:DNA-binding MarR family transcriptional regulator
VDATHQKHLAVALGLDKSSVARLCVRLEEHGHISQEVSAVDARAREIRLTAKGIKVANQLEDSSRSRFDRLLAAIPASERARVVEALAVLRAAAESLDAEDT